jgi:hypothetical protein
MPNGITIAGVDNGTAAAPSKSPLSPAAFAGRQTRPVFMDGSDSTGGLGVIARRGWDANTLAWIEEADRQKTTGIRNWANEAPLRLLRVLMEMHPFAQMAMDGDLSMSFQPGKVRVVAVKDYRSGQGTVDDSETTAISRLWETYTPSAAAEATDGGESLSAHTGSITSLQRVMGRYLNHTGMFAFETVLHDRPKDGLKYIADFDPLTCRWNDDKDLGRIFEQRQNGAVKGWQRLDLATILVGTWEGNCDNPYGIPRNGAFLGEGLADIAEQRSLRDWLYSVAYPHLMFTYPFEQMAKWAEEHPDTLVGLGKNSDGSARDLTPGEWATEQMVKFREFLATLKSDDIFTVPAGGDGKTLGVGSGPAQELEQRRHRVALSLNQLPFLLGITDGGTQAYGLASLTAQTAKLTAFREPAHAGLVAIANLDLRLRGVDMVARVEADPILLSDVLAYWQAERQRNAVINERVDRGQLSPEEGAMLLTGTGMFDESRAYATTTPAATPAALGTSA